VPFSVSNRPTKYKIKMKNYFLIGFFAMCFSCNSNPNNAAISHEVEKAEVIDLGCKDGGECLADHSCCAPKED
jgi:hypothetical protein